MPPPACGFAFPYKKAFPRTSPVTVRRRRLPSPARQDPPPLQSRDVGGSWFAVVVVVDGRPVEMEKEAKLGLFCVKLVRCRFGPLEIGATYVDVYFKG